jgi:hypothetical protein
MMMAALPEGCRLLLRTMVNSRGGIEPATAESARLAPPPGRGWHKMPPRGIPSIQGGFMGTSSFAALAGVSMLALLVMFVGGILVAALVL